MRPKTRLIINECSDPIITAEQITRNSIITAEKANYIFYYIKVSGIPSGNKLIKTIRYPHMRRSDIFTYEDIVDFTDIKFVS